jgi:hypothetical protein
MDPIESLTTNVVAAFDNMLELICSGTFQVSPVIDHNGTSVAIGLVGRVTAADEAFIQARGGEAALQNLAKIIGDHSGLATISFQFE